MKASEYSTSTASQRQRLLAWLLISSIATLQTRDKLRVIHPAGRVQELRRQGHNIVTHKEIVETGEAKHRVAHYVLLVGVRNDA